MSDDASVVIYGQTTLKDWPQSRSRNHNSRSLRVFLSNDLTGKQGRKKNSWSRSEKKIYRVFSSKCNRPLSWCAPTRAEMAAAAAAAVAAAVATSQILFESQLFRSQNLSPKIPAVFRINRISRFIFGFSEMSRQHSNVLRCDDPLLVWPPVSSNCIFFTFGFNQSCMDLNIPLARQLRFRTPRSTRGQLAKLYVGFSAQELSCELIF